ncbi:sigma-54 interaction domain-containing protein [Salidesulfovibrio onnuriiensis]|uniref:sigma-54 interaction domain-containing protein n=1 Tax=Salidesulfovibrio onnuriiensis TaxID=2583823 RepID=UPI00164F47C1|nr:sigma 54-interacting transcriptional regulator [Salidesulfovibrio onnuriiensis]
MEGLKPEPGGWKRAGTDSQELEGGTFEIKAFAEGIQVFENIERFSEMKHLIEFQRKVIDYCADALMVVDKAGIIVYINDSFCEVHNVRIDEVLGKHVTDVIDNTRMHVVAQTCTAEHDHFQDISGQPYVVSRIPIVENGECVGVVGMIRFRYMEEVQLLTDKIRRLQKKIKDLRALRSAHLDTKYSFDNIIGVAEKIRLAKDICMQAAQTDATILLQGESGVGKEVFAQSIHAHSPRSGGPFIRLNCSAIQQSIIESELFGYEEGAFTGARKGGRKGKFELAHEGTIFLDEIGDMPLSAQVKLLRVIQEKEVERLGSEKLIDVDVRIIAATNRNLKEMVAEGTFREDLFYRLNVIPVVIPPLREVPEEIPRLAKSFWQRISRKHGIFHKVLTPRAILVLQNHHWKGNVRELKNVLERLLVMVRHDHICEQDVQRVLIQSTVSPENEDKMFDEGKFGLTALVEKTERRAIRSALATAEGNRSKAAKLLGISRPLLYKKMAKYGLDTQD